MSDQQCSSSSDAGKGARRTRNPLSTGGASTVFPTPSRQLEEEGPTMRSVAILSPAADHGPIGLHTNRIAGLYGTKPSTGLPGRPTTDFGQLKKSSAPSSKQPFDVAPTGNKWSVQQLEPLPTGFPLERTSRRVNAIGSIVAERIAACLFERSIEAKYNDVEGKAKCRTSDYVSFRIRLFAPSGDIDSTTTIVEVQRRKGSAFNFSKDCRAILDAAEGRASSPQTKMPPLKPISAMSCLQGIKIDNDDDNDRADLKATEELLSMDQSDSNLLGLENLEELTRQSSTSQNAVRLATKNVVSGEDDSTSIRAAITSLLQHSSLRGDQSHLRTSKDEIETDYDERMHNLSLSVVHNALSFMAEEGSLTELTRMHSGWFRDTLIPVLIRDVDGARDRPHDACLAAKCLHCLAPYAQRSIADAGAVEALVEAQSFAADNHASLANMADRAIGALR
eukprot:CAMPEP_0181052922 /NCGR_PEP_ID=MMETSP1070-20121207/17841_1 /TAXON_ID=265543 /ORGANISM="Minutocellus polymorphus, Strain NH13" /LENGTH=449 /DNA_ID=CAMNT_0023132033 /DNA_START=286 /DNA_END=1635 /DNA_ORIENTATION=-